jgi:carbon monoxide dehydrogenase subunit G
VKVQGERSFAAPRETVWRVLQDPAQMAEVMPGVESFEVEDDRNWRANVAIPLGLGSLRMSINFEKLEEREPEFSQLRAKGTGVGALMNLVTQFQLSEVDTGTAMAWEADVRIAGPVGSMGQRVLKPIVNQQVQQVLTALDAQVTKAGGGEAPKGAEESLSPLEEESYSDER